MTERERLRAERIDLLSDMVQSLRREHAITREELEKAQQALRYIEGMLAVHLAQRGYPLWLREVWAIAKRGLEP